MAVVALLLTVGFCCVDVNPLGPVHEYTAPLIVEAVSDNTDAAHTGPLLAAVGADGIEFTVAVVVPAVLLHPLTIAVTL
jgi:hypothetical protein